MRETQPDNFHRIPEESQRIRPLQRIAISVGGALLAYTAISHPEASYANIAEPSINTTYTAVSDNELTSDAKTDTTQMKADNAYAAQFTVATYNIWGSNFEGRVKQRAQLATDLIKGSSDVGRFHIVSLQEVEPDQRRLFNRMLPGYAAFPTAGDPDNTIYWYNDMFKKLGGGFVAYPSYGDRGLHASGKHRSPWVKLKHRDSGEVVNVIGGRLPAWNEDPGSDPGGALKRERGAHNIMSWAREQLKNSPRATNIIAFDANSANYLRTTVNQYVRKKKDNIFKGDRSRLVYCILTERHTGQRRRIFQNTYDLNRDVSGHCPTKRHDKPVMLQELVDYVFIDPRNADVLAWKQIKKPAKFKASDHYPVATKIGIR